MTDDPLTDRELVEAMAAMEQVSQTRFPWAADKAVREFARIVREYRKRVTSEDPTAT